MITRLFVVKFFLLTDREIPSTTTTITTTAIVNIEYFHVTRVLKLLLRKYLSLSLITSSFQNEIRESNTRKL